MGASCAPAFLDCGVRGSPSQSQRLPPGWPWPSPWGHVGLEPRTSALAASFFKQRGKSSDATFSSQRPVIIYFRGF